MSTHGCNGMPCTICHPPAPAYIIVGSVPDDPKATLRERRAAQGFPERSAEERRSVLASTLDDAMWTPPPDVPNPMRGMLDADRVLDLEARLTAFERSIPVEKLQDAEIAILRREVDQLKRINAGLIARVELLEGK